MKTFTQIAKIKAVLLLYIEVCDKKGYTSAKPDMNMNFITIIDIARAGKATKEMADYIREKQIVRNFLS